MLEKHLIAKTHPLADKNNIVLWKDYRITVLQPRLFRIEKNKEKIFRDKATQSVWFRNMPKQNFTVEENDFELVLTTDKCRLLIRENRLDCRIFIEKNELIIDNRNNLLGTYRTLDCCDGGYDINAKRNIELGNGVCSKKGVAVFDDVNSLTLDENGEIISEQGKGSDEYVFAYGRNYREAVKALYLITGQVPMVPRFALGNWWSRYHAYSDKEYLCLLNRFEEENVPLTVAAIDMDWHYSYDVNDQKQITKLGRNSDFYGGANGWTGYSWNKKLFPNYRKFLNEVKKKKLKVTLNLHPADGIRWWEDCYEKMALSVGIVPMTMEKVKFNITDANFINNYFSVIHKPYEKDGVDFWWIDWQQGLETNIKGLDPLWSLNHYHYLDISKNHIMPMILSRYCGIGSHRYPIGFSGDTSISWKTLAYLPYFTATASNIGYVWWSHDIGGHHMGEMNQDCYVRHIQWGVFSPINRLHCTDMATITKEPWVYLNGSGKIVEDFMRMRHKMIPFLYSADYRTHMFGTPLVEPLYYYWQDCKDAYLYKTEYVFGEQLIVIPAITPRKQNGYTYIKAWIPEGKWIDVFTGDKYNIDKGGRRIVLMRTLDSIPVLAKEGAILPYSGDNGNSVNNPGTIQIYCYNGDNEYCFYEDGSEIGNSNEHFIFFKSYEKNIKGNIVQNLEIKSSGDINILPKNRVYSIMFPEINEGKLSLYIDGEKIKAKKSICRFVKLDLKIEANKKYLISVAYNSMTEIDYLKKRALGIIIRSEGDNIKKCIIWEKIKKAENVKEYIRYIDNEQMKNELKLRLKETLNE